MIVNVAVLMLETQGQGECSQWAKTARHMEEVGETLLLCCELLTLKLECEH